MSRYPPTLSGIPRPSLLQHPTGVVVVVEEESGPAQLLCVPADFWDDSAALEYDVHLNRYMFTGRGCALLSRREQHWRFLHTKHNLLHSKLGKVITLGGATRFSPIGFILLLDSRVEPRVGGDFALCCPMYGVHTRHHLLTSEVFSIGPPLLSIHLLHSRLGTSFPKGHKG